MSKWRNTSSKVKVHKIKIKKSLKPKISMLTKRLKIYTQAKENSRDDQTQKLYNHIKKEPIKNENYPTIYVKSNITNNKIITIQYLINQ